jgi:hypothetical protein
MKQEGWIPYEDLLAAGWDDFVRNHSRGRFIHLIGFKKTVEAVYKLKPNYWLFREDGRMRAIFPSFYHRGLIYGKRIVSQPFSEYGGILFDPALEKEGRRSIMGEFPSVIEKSKEAGLFDYVEIRCFPDLEGLEAENFRREHLYEYGLLPLRQGLNLMEIISYSVKKTVRQAQARRLELRLVESEDEIREAYYPLHLRSLRRLGSPPHPLAYFLTLRRSLQKHLKIFIARHESRPLAALLGWAVGQSVQITESVSDERYFSMRANDLLHFHFINWAIDNGFRWFDFGPVRYPGQRQYKKKWGVELHDYSYYYAPAAEQRRPLSEQSPAARAGSFIWKILPLRLTAGLGKFLRKQLSI